MNNTTHSTDNRLLAVTILILIGALSRLMPHPDNFTPIAAMALFGGTYLKNKKYAFLIPMTSLFLSDVLLEMMGKTGFHNQRLWVYGTMILITYLGFFLRGREQKQNILVASLTGSFIFFLLTNFGTWSAGYYGYTQHGLAQCYVAAIPFFRGTLMGDLFFNVVLFGGFALVRWASPKLIGKTI